jgi:hypothetical protein
MKKPSRYHKLSQALAFIRDDTYYSSSKNRLRKRARALVKRASRRVIKLQGKQEISDVLRDK